MERARSNLYQQKFINSCLWTKKKGFDYELIKAVSNKVSIPVIASGGMGCHEDLLKVVNDSNADAVAMADILHYERLSLIEIRNYSLKNNLNVRKYEAQN